MNDRIYSGGADRLRRLERIERLEIDKVVEFCLTEKPLKTLLDIGTGSGLFAEAFYKKGIIVSGVDLNAELIEIAKQYLPKSEFKVGYAEELPYKNSSFDASFFGLVFHEVADFEKAMSEAFKVSKKYTFILEWKYKVEDFGPPIEHRLRPAFVTELAKNTGYSNIYEYPLTHLILYTFEKD